MILQPPSVPLSRALLSLLDGIWGVLKSSWGMLDVGSILGAPAPGVTRQHEEIRASLM